MEFIKQLVAFAILSGADETILARDREHLEDAWIHSSNSMTETELLEPMPEESRQRYQSWIDRYLTGQSAAPPALEQQAEETILEKPEEVAEEPPPAPEEKVTKPKRRSHVKAKDDKTK